MTDLAPAKANGASTFTLFGFRFDLHGLKVVGFTFLITRVMVLFIIWVSSITIPMRPGLYLYADPNNLIIDGLIRDDSWWYHNIITLGYNMGNIQTGTQGNVAFFPLYPMVVKMVAAIIGNVFVAGILVSNIAFLIGLGYLYALTRLEFGDAAAARAIFYIAAAPASVFFSAMYTESLFMALVAATFYHARRGHWDWAALLGALTAATRNTGILIAAVIVLEGMYQHGFRFLPKVWNWRAMIEHAKNQVRPLLASWPSLLAAVFACLGLVAYVTYLTNAFGDPLAFIHVQSTWGRAVSPSGITHLFENIVQGLRLGPNIWAGQIDAKTLLNVVALVVFVPLVVGVALKMRPAYAWFTVITFLVPLSTGTSGSMTRYVLMLLPCYMLLAYYGQRAWVDRLVLGIFLPLFAYLTVIYSHWYFAG